MGASTLLERRETGVAAAQPARAPAVETLTLGTARWAPKDRFALWTDYTRTHSAPLVMPNTPTHDYRVAANIREQGEITICRAINDPLGFLRTPRHAAALRSDKVRISYCRRVDGGIESGGKTTRISDGAVYFRDYQGPGHFWSHSVFEETWLFVPREWLTDGGRVTQDFDGTVFQSDHFLSRMMAGRIEAITRHAHDDIGFADAVRSLRAAIEDVFAARSSESHRRNLQRKAERLQRIKGYMARHAADRDLTPDRIADALGLTRSSLYRLLQEEGLQVSAYVADYRLNAIAQSLRDPAWSAASVGDIAALWGHFDQAYLTRVFKKRFGETPSRYRSRGLAETGRAFD